MKFWTDRPLFSWRNSHLKKVRAQSTQTPFCMHFFDLYEFRPTNSTSNGSTFKPYLIKNYDFYSCNDHCNKDDPKYCDTNSKVFSHFIFVLSKWLRIILGTRSEELEHASLLNTVVSIKTQLYENRFTSGTSINHILP